MTDNTMPLLDALLKRGGGDFMRSLAEEVLARLMAFDVEGQIGAARFERSEARTTQRNGYRPRAFDTRLGTLELKLPKLRKGSYFPAFLEPRRTTEQALVAVIQEAWIKGVSTRKVDDLVQAMGIEGVNRRRKLTPYRRSILTPLLPSAAVAAARRSGSGLRSRAAAVA